MIEHHGTKPHALVGPTVASQRLLHRARQSATDTLRLLVRLPPDYFCDYQDVAVELAGFLTQAQLRSALGHTNLTDPVFRPVLEVLHETVLEESVRCLSNGA